ncbi:MAG: outer membrane receptor for ferrienterochelin and colicins [Bacteroidia bacterium]|jgi:outer membrane receptor for ferrienterochelin and colicins
MLTTLSSLAELYLFVSNMGNLFFKKIFIFIAIVALPSSQLLALENQTTPDSLFVTGSLSPYSSSSALHIVRVVTHEQIVMMNAQNLNDVLRYVINSFSVYSGKDGYNLDFFGNGRKNVKILLNGMPIWQSSIDKIDINQLSVMDVDRIEIMYGSSGVLYGSNASSGVINIISKVRRDKIAQVVSNFNTNSKGETNIFVKPHFNLGRHELDLGYGRYFFGGYEGGDSGRVYQWKPSRRITTEINYKYSILNGLKFYFSMLYIHNLAQDRSYPIPNTLRVYDTEQKTINTNLQAGVRGKLSKYHTIDFSHSYSRYRLENNKTIKILDRNEAIDDPNVLPFDRLTYDEYFTQFKIARNNKTKAFNYTGGIEFSHQRDLERNKINAVKTNITQISLLGNTSWQVNPLLLTQGGMRYTNSNKFTTPLIFEGKLHYDMSDDVVLLASYSRGYRIPTFNELFYTYENPDINIKGNLNLTSETYQQFNTSMIVNSGPVTFYTTMFWQNINNGIQLVPVNVSEQSYQFVNSQAAKYIGQTIALDLNYDQITTKLVLSNTGLNQFPEAIGSYYFFQDAAANVIVRNKNKDFQLGIATKYNGKRNETRENALGQLEDFNQEGFWLIDFSIQKSFLDQKLQFILGIKNLSDTKDVRGLYLPLDRLSDDEINSKIPLSIDYGRRIWFTIRSII